MERKENLGQISFLQKKKKKPPTFYLTLSLHLRV